MSPRNFIPVFTEHLDLELSTIEDMDFKYPRQDLILRLLLKWLKKNDNPTHEVLAKVYCIEQQHNTFDIKEVSESGSCTIFLYWYDEKC